MRIDTMLMLYMCSIISIIVGVKVVGAAEGVSLHGSAGAGDAALSSVVKLSLVRGDLPVNRTADTTCPDCLYRESIMDDRMIQAELYSCLLDEFSSTAAENNWPNTIMVSNTRISPNTKRSKGHGLLRRVLESGEVHQMEAMASTASDGITEDTHTGAASCSSLDGPHCASVRAAHVRNRHARPEDSDDAAASERRKAQRRVNGRINSTSMLNRYRENNEPFTIYLDVSDTDSDPFATWAASIESMLENAVKLDNSGDGGVIDQLEQLGFDASTINQLVDTATEIILASETTDSLRGLEEMIMEGLEEELDRAARDGGPTEQHDEEMATEHDDERHRI